MWKKLDEPVLRGGFVVKRSMFALLSLCIAFGTFAPAFADDDGGLDKAVQGSLLPIRIAGVGTGLVVGCPIAVVRETGRTYVHLTSGAADKVGGHTSAPSCVLAQFFAAPASLVVGPAKGMYLGSKNAIVHGFNEPFNPESMTLGKLEE